MHATLFTCDAQGYQAVRLIVSIKSISKMRMILNLTAETSSRDSPPPGPSPRVCRMVLQLVALGIL
jgi:hypothetical protein